MEFIERVGNSWKVRFIQNDLVVVQKTFKDKDYEGGSEESLYYAQCWRNDKYLELVRDRKLDPPRSEIFKNKLCQIITGLHIKKLYKKRFLDMVGRLPYGNNI